MVVLHEVVWESSHLSLSFPPVGYGTRREKLGDESLPSRFDLHGLIRLFLPPESASQLPSSFLLTPSLCNTPIHPHTSDIES